MFFFQYRLQVLLVLRILLYYKKFDNDFGLQLQSEKTRIRTHIKVGFRNGLTFSSCIIENIWYRNYILGKKNTKQFHFEHKISSFQYQEFG